MTLQNYSERNIVGDQTCGIFMFCPRQAYSASSELWDVRPPKLQNISSRRSYKESIFWERWSCDSSAGNTLRGNTTPNIHNICISFHFISIEKVTLTCNSLVFVAITRSYKSSRFITGIETWRRQLFTFLRGIPDSTLIDATEHSVLLQVKNYFQPHDWAELVGIGRHLVGTPFASCQ